LGPRPAPTNADATFGGKRLLPSYAALRSEAPTQYFICEEHHNQLIRFLGQWCWRCCRSVRTSH